MKPLGRHSMLGAALQTAVLVGLLAAVLGGAAVAGDSRPPESPTPTMTGRDDRPGPEDPGDGAVPPPPIRRGGDSSSEPGGWWVVAVLGLGVAAGLYVTYRRRHSPENAPAATQAGALLTVLRRRLAEGSSAASVVIACWQGLERLAAERGRARRPSETVSEFADRASATLGLPSRELARLGALYERAWYSRDELGDDDAESAGRLLGALQEAADPVLVERPAGTG